MRTINAGDRIEVDTVLFSGWAEVTGRVSCDFFPIEITLDEGDYAGYRYMRVGKDDIIRKEGD